MEQPPRFLTDEELQTCLEHGEIFEHETWHVRSIHQASYGIRLGSEVHVSRAAESSGQQTRRYQVVRLRPAESLVLEPGDNALLFSVEHLRMPTDMLAITIPRGLFVASSLSPGASYIDPGFAGPFCFPVTNTSDRVIKIPYGIELARTFFFRLGGRVRKPFSTVDTTSLTTELEWLPASSVRTIDECHLANENELESTIQKGPMGPELVELLTRSRRRQMLFLAAALVWPVCLLLANSDTGRTVLGNVVSGYATLVGNVLAGVLTVAVLTLGPKIRRRLR